MKERGVSLAGGTDLTLEMLPDAGSVLDSLGQCVFVKDRALRYVRANRAFCQSLGAAAPKDVVGKDDFAFYPRALAEKFRADDRRVLLDGNRSEGDEQTVWSGKVRTVRIVKTPLRGPNGIDGVVGIFWDITDQRHFENQVRKTQKMEAVGQLAGGIAQDFNNLLTAILGNVGQARLELAGDAAARAVLARAEEAAQRAAALTRQLLGFARHMQPHPEPLDLNVAVHEALRKFRSETQHKFDIRCQLEARPWKVQADPVQLQHMLGNLLANARDAMPRGGMLVLETANVQVQREPASGLDKGACLCLPVAHAEARPGQFFRLRLRDSGPGMAPEVVSHLFEPFFSTKDAGKGAGLSLALVYGIIKEHDGWIECHSAPGAGTVFDIYLPRLVTAPVAKEPALAARGRETVLLVDDQETVRCIGREILESFGYRVLLASSGDKAIEIFEQELAVDLVLLDFAMPELDLILHRLRGLDAEVRVLLSAAYPAGPALRAVQTHGVAGFLAKPFRHQEMARTVRESLERRRLVTA